MTPNYAMICYALILWELSALTGYVFAYAIDASFDICVDTHTNITTTFPVTVYNCTIVIFCEITFLALFFTIQCCKNNSQDQGRVLYAPAAQQNTM